jgi:hypothetical protein
MTHLSCRQSEEQIFKTIRSSFIHLSVRIFSINTDQCFQIVPDCHVYYNTLLLHMQWKSRVTNWKRHRRPVTMQMHNDRNFLPTFFFHQTATRNDKQAIQSNLCSGSSSAHTPTALTAFIVSNTTNIFTNKTNHT